MSTAQKALIIKDSKGELYEAETYPMSDPSGKVAVRVTDSRVFPGEVISTRIAWIFPSQVVEIE